MSESSSETIWTTANKVTLLRILLVPVFFIAIISPWPAWLQLGPEVDVWKPWIAAFVFVAISCTDFIDGHLARSRNEVTTLGKFMDPLADKMLVCAALLALIELGSLPSWVVLFIIVREFIVSGLRMIAASQNYVIAASYYGKAKTVFQMVAIVLFVVKDSQQVANLGPVAFNALYVFSWIVMAVALVLTLLSMVDYLSKGRQLLGFGQGKARRRKARADAERTADANEIVATDDLEGEGTWDLAARVVQLASEQGKTIATAESCTGGRIGAAITHVAGSSAVMAGGVISYANDVKRDLLGVPQGVLDAHGAVSSQTACQMAAGARRSLGVDLAVSATGIAGPGGATLGKPVGTVWLGIADADGAKAELFEFSGDREAVRTQTVDAALQLLIGALEADE